MLRMRPVILLFGDSITQQGFGMDGKVGWASLLASDYSRRCDVVNRGYFGYNTKHAVDLLPSLFREATTTTAPNSQLLFATLYFGANDAVMPGNPQHIPLQEFSSNLHTVIQSIRLSSKVDNNNNNNNSNESDLPIILMTPPPLDADAWRKFKGFEVSNRSNENHRTYGLEMKKVAQSHNHCACLDVWELLQGHTSADIYGKYLTDGLHLNEQGNRMLYQGLIELIKNEYPNLAPMQGGSNVGIPVDGKSWDELC